MAERVSKRLAWYTLRTMLEGFVRGQLQSWQGHSSSEDESVTFFIVKKAMPICGADGRVSRESQTRKYQLSRLYHVGIDQ
jgi:hypothetical protein